MDTNPKNQNLKKTEEKDMIRLICVLHKLYGMSYAMLEHIFGVDRKKIQRIIAQKRKVPGPTYQQEEDQKQKER